MSTFFSHPLEIFLKVGLKQLFIFLDGTWAGIDCFDPEGNVTFENSDAYLKYGLSENNTMSPVEQYWK